MDSLSLNNEWKGTRSRKKRKSRQQIITTSRRPSTQSLIQTVQDEFALHEPRWLSETQKLIQTSFDLIAELPHQPPSHILCLGLGSPSTSATSRVQLAWLLNLSSVLKIERSRVALYDPIFTPEDEKLLTNEYGFSLETSTACQELAANTILVMPHCDLTLYEQVFSSNPLATLHRIVMICNLFQEYLDSNPGHVMQTKAASLSQHAALMECWPLPLLDRWPTAFNSTAVQFFSPATRQQENQ